MTSELFTFGEYLSVLLKKKKISVTSLAQITNTKSKTSIHRILKDECSILVTERFEKKLLKTNLLNLSDIEIASLEESIEVSRSGKDTYQARKLMLEYIYSSNSTVIDTINYELADDLKNIFASYQAFKKSELLVFNSCFPEFTDALHSILLNDSHVQLKIRHSIFLGELPQDNVIIFASIYKLLNFDHYHVYYFDSDNQKQPGDYIMNNIIVIDKVNEIGEHFTDLLRIEENKCLSYLADIPGNSLYAFYSDHFNKNIDRYKALKRTYNKNPLDTMNLLGNFLLEPEKATTYRLKSNMGIGFIPYDILYALLKEANYFGLSEHDPRIQTLIHNVSTRINNYLTLGTPKYNFFTKRGIYDFVKTHVTSDHVNGFRPFTSQEIKQILQHVITVIQTKDFIKVYLLKNDYFISNIEFAYFEKQFLWFYDSSSGYDNGFFDVSIDAKPIIDLFDDFLKNEIIKYHVISQDETIQFFQNIVNQL